MKNMINIAILFWSQRKKPILFIIIFYCDYRFFSVSPIFLYYDALVLSLEVALKAGDRSSGALGTDIFVYWTNVASLLSVAAISPEEILACYWIHKSAKFCLMQQYSKVINRSKKNFCLMFRQIFTASNFFMHFLECTVCKNRLCLNDPDD